MSTYSWLKLIHILAAIVAVGTNVTYFVWLSYARRHEAAAAPVLDGIKRIDSRLANPAYAVLPIAGILMVLDGGLGFSTFWIALAIGLYVLVGAMAGLVFSPSLRKQAAMAEAGETGTAAYADAAKRTVVTGALTMVPILVIVYLMVMKPTV
jgi:uncharacterized membrane protein